MSCSATSSLRKPAGVELGDMATEREQVQQAWHVLPEAELLEQLSAKSQGLTQAEAQQRLLQYGPNRLPEKGVTPLWLITLRQLMSPLIYILILAAIVSGVMGDLEDAGFIVLVLVINTAVGAYQEAQAEKSSHALRSLLKIQAQVERDGEIREVLADDLVPGDLLWLESGNRVAADVRLLSTNGLEVDESLLTGESIAADKHSDWTGDVTAPLGDRRNMAFAGSLVARGRAKGVVVATGAATQVGQLALDVLSNTGGRPPLMVRMERFTNYIAVATLGISILIGVINIVLWQRSLFDTFMLVTALAVAAIPEGLPVALTVALAVATTRMAQRNVIVRRLAAVEGLGSCTLVATDKTGTLTCNELTVRELRLPDGTVFHATGEGFAPQGEVRREDQPVDLEQSPGLKGLVETGVLCNEAELYHRDGAWGWRGDAVDIALLSLGRKLNIKYEQLIDRYPLINEIPFEPEHRFAATYHRHGSATYIAVKGAPERIREMCAERLSESERQQLDDAGLEMAKAGLRVIALAIGELPVMPAPNAAPPVPTDLRHLGLVGMIDPLRPGVREAVAACHSAGVEVTMITGDHQITALAIARDLGLADADDQVLSAVELEGKSSSQIAEIMQRVRVFARVTPRQKLEIVRAAQEAGHFVAVTGDGVNDAPALRTANIGVAMGKSGTDVARDASDLVISDDNFHSIVSGIEEGRVAYDNIRKVINLLVSTGAAELMMVLLAVLTGVPIPLLPVQLLWLNLVTNGIQGVAMAFEPGEGDSLKHPPRPPGEPVFNTLMIERVAVAVAFVGGGGFLLFYLCLLSGWSEAAARNLLLLTLVLFENFHVGNCRSETKSIFALSPLRSRILFFGTLGAFLIHVAGMYLPVLQSVLKTQPVGLTEWLLAIAVGMTIIPAIEIHKWLWARRFPEDNRVQAA